jgi:4-amino-4-deoxy-L-arabinose transferase-like glycosyltransferase
VTSTATPPTAARLRWLCVVAAATFLPAIAYHYVGEEAIFPLSSLEMWYHGEWLQKTIYGGPVYHTPLFNWLIVAAASALGWEHMLAVARVITIAATCTTALVVAGLARMLYGDRALALFAALIYLTLADVMFYRGWLAYVDPLFALLTAAAVAALWAGCLRGKAAWLWAAAAALALAMLAKSLTAYVFYVLAALVLFARDSGYRAFLLSPASWAAHAAMLCFPLAWGYLVPGTDGQGSRLVGDILAKLTPPDLADYFIKLVAFPAETALRLAPALLIAGWFARGNAAGFAGTDGRHARAALWIAALNFLPYWLAPQAAIRYLMPLYPFAAVGLAWVIWGAGARAVNTTQRWLTAMIALKVVLAVMVFPLYQYYYRGASYEKVARQILERTAGHALYITNDSASGLAVAAHLDVLRLPAAPLTRPPARWETGFVVAYTPDAALGAIVQQYRLGGTAMYLLCRGAACEGR